MNLSWIPFAAAVVPMVWTIVSAGQPAAREPVRVAFVSSQRILNESPGARAEVARFRATQQQRANELRAKQQALQATRLKLAQAGDEAARDALRQQEKQQREELESAAAEARADQQADQRQLADDLQVRIKPIMEELAKSRGLDVVLNSDTAVVWGSPRVNLTDEVLERLNTKAPTSPGPDKP